MYEKTCETCGSVYKITSQKIPLRDKDSINCDICGKELISWNGGIMYDAELIKKGKDITDKF